MLSVGVFLREPNVSTQGSNKTTKNSERLGWEARLGSHPEPHVYQYWELNLSATSREKPSLENCHFYWIIENHSLHFRLQRITSFATTKAKPPKFSFYEAPIAFLSILHIEANKFTSLFFFRHFHTKNAGISRNQIIECGWSCWFIRNRFIELHLHIVTIEEIIFIIRTHFVVEIRFAKGYFISPT